MKNERLVPHVGKLFTIENGTAYRLVAADSGSPTCVRHYPNRIDIVEGLIPAHDDHLNFTYLPENVVLRGFGLGPSKGMRR